MAREREAKTLAFLIRTYGLGLYQSAVRQSHSRYNSFAILRWDGVPLGGYHCPTTWQEDAWGR